MRQDRSNGFKMTMLLLKINRYLDFHQFLIWLQNSKFVLGIDISLDFDKFLFQDLQSNLYICY
jgi:hypothetical protein